VKALDHEKRESGLFAGCAEVGARYLTAQASVGSIP